MELLRDGFEVIEQCLPCEWIEQAIFELEGYSGKLRFGGVRNAETKFEFVRKICASDFINKKVSTYLSGTPQLVRAILFDKTPESNWSVSWHQDKTVAVNEKRNVPGWGPWSVKEGVVHVQPPLAVLNTMLTVRVHLDSTDAENGCLKVIPKSHLKGILQSSEIQAIVSESDFYLCEVGAGGAVFMKPHILHSSCKSISGNHRRVLHLEYCSYKLEDGLKWAASR